MTRRFLPSTKIAATALMAWGSVSSALMARQARATREAVFDALTAHVWRSVDLDHLGWMARMNLEFTVTTYRGDGTFRVQLITDYVPSPVLDGRWTLEGENGGPVVLRLESGKRVAIAFDADGRLLMDGEVQYQGEPVPKRVGSVQDLKPLALPAEVQGLARLLCARRWKRANDLDWNSQPTSVEFRKDMTYTSTYRNGQRVNQGRWWAGQSAPWNPYEWQGITAKGPGGSELRAASPAFPEQLQVAAMPDGNILINGDVYVPENRPLILGDSRSYWSLWEDKRLDVRLKYPLPLAAGMHAAFEIEMTYRDGKSGNHAGPIQLNRLVLAMPRDSGSVPGMLEFASKDLKGVSLAPGETRTLSMKAEFPSNATHIEWNLQLRNKNGARMDRSFWHTLALPQWRSQEAPVLAR